MQKIILHISLTLRGPLLTQSSNPGQLGVDAVVARNYKDQFYIPGTLISGKIRQSLEELQNAVCAEKQPQWFPPELDDWLGVASENDFARTKRLFFTDFVLDARTTQFDKIRHRIKIDDERGSVDEHQLVVTESPFISGEDYQFNGQVHFFSTQKTADKIIQNLQAALKWLSQLGAYRSTGFGEVVKAGISSTDNLKLTPPASTTIKSAERIGFFIQPQYPFCLTGKPVADNLFESETIIPGAAIKGCIATTWNHMLDQQQGRIDHAINDYPELSNNFSKLIFSHAFPGGEENKRPVVAPLSLVRTEKDGPLYDVALLATPCLIDNQPPDFAVDWKDSPETLKSYPWPYIRFKDWGWKDNIMSELRVRTAIDREELRSAENELFAYEQIIPEDTLWYGELDLSKIDESQHDNVLSQLQALCSNGLIGLGKTKTPFEITFTEPIESVIASDEKPIHQNVWVITLQTDALLGSPEALDESSGKAELSQMYQTAWKEMLGEALGEQLVLLRYFARQRFSGGRFRHKTMQNNHSQYRPWLLTEAGSVFIFQAKAEADLEVIEKKIKCWQSQGLPLTESVVEWYGLGDDPWQYWKYTPFVPENGYGEIAVNLQSGTFTQLIDGDKSIQPINCIQYDPKEASA